VRGRRKIDAVYFGLSLIKNSQNGACDAACMRKHQLPARFAQMAGEKRDISVRARGAPQ
jgi:hypothetical protein